MEKTDINMTSAEIKVTIDTMLRENRISFFILGFSVAMIFSVILFVIFI